MKKVLLVLALVAVYGVSMAMTQAPAVTTNNEVAIVADANNSFDKEEDKKEAKSETKAKGCTGEKAAKAEGCSGEKATKGCCSGEKSAEASEGCASKCASKATAEAKKTGECGGK